MKKHPVFLSYLKLLKVLKHSYIKLPSYYSILLEPKPVWEEEIETVTAVVLNIHWAASKKRLTHFVTITLVKLLGLSCIITMLKTEELQLVNIQSQHCVPWSSTSLVWITHPFSHSSPSWFKIHVWQFLGCTLYFSEPHFPPLNKRGEHCIPLMGSVLKIKWNDRA